MPLGKPEADARHGRTVEAAWLDRQEVGSAPQEEPDEASATPRVNGGGPCARTVSDPSYVDAEDPRV